jgi:AcrR family transcriptional regulator
METIVKPTPLTRPGGRSAKVRAAVHLAVEELLTEVPADSLTLPMIAGRAGVHPTTVYRRWGSLGELLAAVAESSFSGDIVTPDTGALRTDLEQWVSDVATDLNDPDVIALMRATIGNSGDAGCSACVADRHTQLEAMIQRERNRGNEAPDADRAADILLGPLYYRATFTDRKIETDWARSLVGDLLD